MNRDAKIQPGTDRRWFIGAGVVAVGVGVLIGFGQMMGAAIVLFLLGAAGLFLWPGLGYAAVIGTVILGQLVRLPVPGSDQFFLLNDALIPALVIVWGLRRLGGRSFWLPRTTLWLPMAAVLVAMIASLIANRGWYDASDLIGGGLYIVRWVEYAALFFITADIARNRIQAKKIIAGLVWSGVILAVLGFAQLVVFPDFSFMAPKGWDPHIGRLLSTWFDPNFLAGYLAALIAISLSLALRGGRKTVWWWAATGIMILAVVLTYSRSGYLALAVAVGIVTTFRSRVMLFLGILVLAGTILFVPRVQERVIGIRSVDVTAQLRIVSWQNAFQLISEHPVLGVGYNLYRQAQVRDNLIKDATAHSATGADSSLLLIAATTGVLGLAAFLWLLVALAWETVKTATSKELSPEWQVIGFATFVSFAALLVHSQFVNSLFFPHLMEYIWIMAGVVVAIRPENAS